MIVIDEVAFGSSEFKVSAVSAQNGKLPSAVRSKASVIVSKGSLLMFFCKKSLADWIRYMYKSEALYSIFPIVFRDGCSL